MVDGFARLPERALSLSPSRPPPPRVRRFRCATIRSGDTILKKVVFLLLLLAAAVIAWGVFRKSEPPRVPFARVKRQTLVSNLPTNGKVEPFEWQPVRAETAGVVS